MKIHVKIARCTGSLIAHKNIAHKVPGSGESDLCTLLYFVPLKKSVTVYWKMNLIFLWWSRTKLKRACLLWQELELDRRGHWWCNEAIFDYYIQKLNHSQCGSQYSSADSSTSYLSPYFSLNTHVRESAAPVGGSSAIKLDFVWRHKTSSMIGKVFFTEKTLPK